jgi:two-component system, cell cycle sensor histidine kinase and response regulator CckA
MAERTSRGNAQEPDEQLLISQLGNQARLSAIFDRAGVGIAVCTKEGIVLVANPALATILGRSTQDLRDLHFSQFTHPEDLPSEMALAGRLLRGEIESYCIEKRYLRRDGAVVWGELTVTLIPGIDDENGSLLGTVVDITERKRAEEALRFRTEEMKEAQRLARIGSAVRDLQSNTIAWSDELYHIFGLDSKLPPPTWLELKASFTAESQARLHAAKDALQRENRDFELELQLVRADGAVRWITYRAEVEFEPSGKPAWYRTTIQDITERWLANRALRESEEKYRGIVETMTEGVWVLDQDNRTAFVNQQMAAMLGCGVEEMLGRDVLDFKDEEARAIALQKLERRRQGITEQYDSTFQTKDGRRLTVLISTRPLWDGSGRYAGSLGIITNITERSLLEERLHQAHKMEAIGRLAGGVAHDFNNLLTVINGYSDMLLRNVEAGDRVHSQLTEIRKAGQSAQELTSQMLAFSHSHIRATEVLNLSSVIEDVEKMLRRMIGEDIELVTVFEPGLGQVKAGRTEVTQILLNLAINARDAMPTGGTLTFETRSVEVDESYAQTHPGAHPGAHVLLMVIDTGVGIDAESQQHLFEPFFTTKQAGKGTGLGLATVYGIVSQRGGWIQVDSKLRKGTTFRIYLPQVDGAPSKKREHPKPPRQQLRGTETILVVEDQPQVRELTSSILREFGYQTLEASHGEEALRIAVTHPGPLHLLLTDVIMPGMHGLELATRLKTLRRTPILFMSGYSGRMEAIDDSEVAYIQKPFTPDALARKVREVLRRGQSRR